MREHASSYWMSPHEPMRAILECIPDVASTTNPVLIVGERGTGRRSLARLIHHSSPRAEKPFEEQDLFSAFREDHEAWLFGWPDDLMFKSQSTGAFERASGGTLYVDRAQRLSPEVQKAVLEVLRTGRVATHHGAGERRVADTRLIAPFTTRPATATRPHGLGVLLSGSVPFTIIHLPPLRERLADLPTLTAIFLAEANLRMGKSVELDERVLGRLDDYSWPENLAQLSEVVWYAVRSAESGVITLDGLRRINTASEVILKERWPEFFGDHERFSDYINRTL